MPVFKFSLSHPGNVLGGVGNCPGGTTLGDMSGEDVHYYTLAATCCCANASLTLLMLVAVKP